MAYSVIVSKSASKALLELPKKMQARIKGVINTLAINPFPPTAVKLKGREGYRIRTNDYRIIYTVEKDVLVVWILIIGHRREIYKK